MTACVLPFDSPPTHRELQDMLRFECLLSELSATFIAVPVHDIDRAIEESLARIVDALDIERSTLTRLFTLAGNAEATHSIPVDGIAPVQQFLAGRESNPWALSMAIANRPIAFSRLDDLPPEASVDKESWRRIGLKSHVMMPIMVAGHLQGALGFGAIGQERPWPHALLGRMRLLSEIFGNALARKRAHEDLALAVGFERLASSILASLVLAPPNEQGKAISFGLGAIGEFVGAEHVALWQEIGGDGRHDPTHEWRASGLAVAPIPCASNLPWLRGRIDAGHMVRVTLLAELPAAAQSDVTTLQSSGIRSLLVVPVAGRTASALMMATVQRHHAWPDALLPGVQLLAEVLGSLNARETAERRRLAAEVEATHWRERLAHLVRVHTVGEMSVALAHEITQPLGAIENYALAARHRAGEPSPDMARVAGLLDKVIGQCTRAGDVVARMRGMAQRHELDPKPIRIWQAVQECVGMVKMDCDLRDIRIASLPASHLPVVVVDEIHVQQVVLNLLRNAMEAIELAPPGGPREIAITIRASEHDEVQVDVADRGVGIAEGDLERVFESFYSTKSSGLGVGLAICRKLIEAHGGKLWAAHNAGGGASFSFTLPRLP